jgi:hypothetical protein
MYPHRIRLRGPWDCEPLAWSPIAPDLALPGPRRVTMPCRWGEAGLEGFRGRVRFRRRFGYPGRLDAHERVWLTFAGIDGVATVRLNGIALGELAEPGEFEITPQLALRNELLVEVDGNESGGLWGEVALEVRCSAYLRGVAVTAFSQGSAVELHAQGEVAGAAEGPLELYVVLDRSTVAYAAVLPGPFHLVADTLDRQPWAERPTDAGPFPIARVELVRGASVWFRVEHEVLLRPEIESGRENSA